MTQDQPYNVYADLGVANPEEMLRKARIVTKISQVMNRSTGGTANAAGVLGLSEANLNELLRGQFNDCGEKELLKYLEKLKQSESFAGAKLAE